MSSVVFDSQIALPANDIGNEPNEKVWFKLSKKILYLITFSDGSWLGNLEWLDKELLWLCWKGSQPSLVSTRFSHLMTTLSNFT